MSHGESIHRTGRGRPFLPVRSRIRTIAGLGEIYHAWQTRRLYRGELKRLLRVGAHMIEDVGLTVAEARSEINKPFWQA